MTHKQPRHHMRHARVQGNQRVSGGDDACDAYLFLTPQKKLSDLIRECSTSVTCVTAPPRPPEPPPSAPFVPEPQQSGRNARRFLAGEACGAVAQPDRPSAPPSAPALPAASPAPDASPDPAAPDAADPDALARAELACPDGPAAHYRPGDPDPLAEGLASAALDAPRLRRVAMFAAAPTGAIRGWRLTASLRAFGAGVALDGDGLIRPRGFGRLPEALRELARAHAEPLRRWLRLERAADAPAEALPDARPPFGADPTPLATDSDWCICCGPPPPNTAAAWWHLPDGHGWSCAQCVPWPLGDDRVSFGFGLAGPMLAPPILLHRPRRAARRARAGFSRAKET